MPNPVTWFEISGKDGAKSQKFYADLFGWAVDASNPMNYGMIEPQDGHGTGGGITGADHTGVMIYVEVDDLQKFLDKAVGLGGKIVVPPTEVPGMVNFAQFSDIDGNLIGLFKSGSM